MPDPQPPQPPQPPRRRTFLADAEPGDRMDDVFVLVNPQLGTTRKGDPFLKFLVGDRTAQVAAKWWSQGPDTLAKLPSPSGVVRVKGQIEDYNGTPQFRVDTVKPIRNPDEIDYADLLPGTDKDTDAMWERVQSLLSGIDQPHLRAIVGAYLDDEELMANFRRAPAAVSLHHGYLGGLLEHTSNAMAVADAVCGFYPDLNRDLVVAGVFLHDLGKTWELSYDVAFAYTDGGNLVGHVVKAALWLERYADRAAEALGEPVPRPMLDVLQNLLLSHHGPTELNYGSARNMMTPEALAVHMIEALDAKLTPALALCRGGESDAPWTEYQRNFDGRLFRPDLFGTDDAPAEPPRAVQNPLFG